LADNYPLFYGELPVTARKFNIKMNIFAG